MRSVNRLALALAAALALGGCGDWSNEDLRFLAALPTTADVRVQVPAAGGAALSACGLGTADAWLAARATSDGLDAGVAWAIGLVDVVRRRDPTHRADDRREWGPFDDARHPGIEIVVVMQRGADAEGRQRYEYVFAARPRGTAWWIPLLDGAFVGGSAARGAGTVALDFDAVRALGMEDGPDAPRGTMRIAYDRQGDPRTTVLTLAEDGFRLPRFTYAFAGYADGSGRFVYRFRDANGNVLTVDAGFDPAGRGRGAAAVQTAAGATGGFRQCWDASACLVYVDDPGDYSCDLAPCSAGALSACPAVVSAPF
jgi:hypothetical protein